MLCVCMYVCACVQDEPELKVACLWHEAAENSTNPSEKLLNFKNSIEILVVNATRYYVYEMEGPTVAVILHCTCIILWVSLKPTLG